MATTEEMQSLRICKQGSELSIDSTVTDIGTDDFNPKKHLDFQEPERIYTMKDLKLDSGAQVSPVAVSEPFRLFTEEAVERMRQEIFKPEILENYQYTSNLAHCQLRGFAEDAAPFIYETWKDPEVLAIVSKIAGIELVPAMDFEIAHINLSTKSDKQKQEEAAVIKERKLYEMDEGISGCPWEDDEPIVDWHRDSYPFVCVTMLSDCTNMQGGETALRTGDDNIMKVRGPGKGCAVILQGRYIEHRALRALGTCERITSVTSFRPKHHSIKDETVLTTVRGISDLNKLYGQFMEYRLEILEERIRGKLRELRKGGNKFNTRAAKAFLDEQEEFLAHTNKEIVPNELVTRNHIDDDCIEDHHVDAKPTKSQAQEGQIVQKEIKSHVNDPVDDRPAEMNTTESPLHEGQSRQVESKSHTDDAIGDRDGEINETKSYVDEGQVMHADTKSPIEDPTEDHRQEVHSTKNHAHEGRISQIDNTRLPAMNTSSMGTAFFQNAPSPVTEIHAL